MMDAAEPIMLAGHPHPIDRPLARAIADAQDLLRYAAQSGIAIDAATATALVRADRCLRDGGIDDAATIEFYAAATRLAAQVRPVTAVTLRCSQAAAGTSIIRTAALSVVLALCVVVFSGVTFITGSMSKDIDLAIASANDLAVALRNQVGPGSGRSDTVAPAAPAARGVCDKPLTPPDPPIAFSDTAALVKELQDFAAADRGLLRTATKLDFFVARAEDSPLDAAGWADPGAHRLELDPALLNMRRETFCQIATYQEVRLFAQNVREDSNAIYGALSGYVLPVLYALLGAFAYALRDFSDRVKRQTYLITRHGNMARTIAALTAGAIISLFNIFSQGSPLQPLAVAFLVGYGVEAFYSFLDALLTTFSARRPGETAAPNK